MMAAKQKLDPAIRLASTMLPAQAVANGNFRIVGVANYSAADQRHMIRSKETQTVMRLSHLERLHRLKTISGRQLAICQWYADQHERGFEVASGCTANYCGAGGGGFGSMDLLARHADQYLARENYATARQSISSHLLSLFERVVLGRIGLGEAGGKARYSRLGNSFRLAVDQLDDAIGHMIAIER